MVYPPFSIHPCQALGSVKAPPELSNLQVKRTQEDRGDQGWRCLTYPGGEKWSSDPEGLLVREVDDEVEGIKKDKEVKGWWIGLL